MSIVLRPQIAPRDAPFLILVASNALAETIKSYGTNTLVRWSNDILIEGKK
jgi:BirA family transcriptional regulator, biotin operon repressor / biotin---[acetyl-CoA-carboxylase] ligase